MLSVRHGPRRWHSDATSRHSPGSAKAPERPGEGRTEGWGPRGLPRTHPSMASSTSCLIPLPSNTASCEAPASNTALKPKVASCLAALTWPWGQRWLRGCRSPPSRDTPAGR